MKSKKVISLILIAMLLAGTMLGCNKKETKQIGTTQEIKTKQEDSKWADVPTNSTQFTVTTKVNSKSKTPKATSSPVAKPNFIPIEEVTSGSVTKSKFIPIADTTNETAHQSTQVSKGGSTSVAKRVPDTKQVPGANPTYYIDPLTGTVKSSSGTATATLLPVLVSGVKLGQAKITTASVGFKQIEIDKLNSGLSDGRKLYAYWISTRHDYDIFVNRSKENVKNKWLDHMVEAAELLGHSSVNTAETKALAREFQFIAQEIVNYQTYETKSKSLTALGDAAVAERIGATIAIAAFSKLTYDIKNKL